MFVFAISTLPSRDRRLALLTLKRYAKTDGFLRECKIELGSDGEFLLWEFRQDGTRQRGRYCVDEHGQLFDWRDD